MWSFWTYAVAFIAGMMLGFFLHEVIQRTLRLHWRNRSRFMRETVFKYSELDPEDKSEDTKKLMSKKPGGWVV